MTHPASRSWIRDFKKIKPLVEWNNHMGCVTATYAPGLKKYLMCVTDGWPTVAKMTSYILESDVQPARGAWFPICRTSASKGTFLIFRASSSAPTDDPVAVLLREFQHWLERSEAQHSIRRAGAMACVCTKSHCSSRQHRRRIGPEARPDIMHEAQRAKIKRNISILLLARFMTWRGRN